jgi:hypothetical protein
MIAAGLPASVEAIARERWDAWERRMHAAGFRYNEKAQHIRHVARVRGEDGMRLVLPHDDHPRAWRKPHVGILRAAHVYEHSHGEKARAEVRAFCERYALSAHFSHELDRYYPGRTMLIVVAAPQVLRLVELAPN